MVLTLVKLLAHIVGGSAQLPGEHPCAGGEQVVRKIVVSSFDAPAIIRAGIHGRHRCVVWPLMTDKQQRPFALGEIAHLHNRSIAAVTSSLVRSGKSISDWLTSAM
ncbi:hypothetical protein MSM1_08340 [Mycobacterium sp. SM1]|uniref:hypothetical protein n=1 Tax=Mycobacterium sp. SM1 TaxID=2816243 RepID=UPI001BCEC466|nr:hypothetical protein [Mycobacterium sp. SM1]MBS4728352.1 hypothetical protein [Mycobacterium sp. SM1]